MVPTVGEGDLKDAIQRSHDWMVACAALVDGVTFKTTLRARVAVALHHLCTEQHQAAMSWLITTCGGCIRPISPAVRSIYTRMHWYFACASEAKLVLQP